MSILNFSNCGFGNALVNRSAVFSVVDIGMSEIRLCSISSLILCFLILMCLMFLVFPSEFPIAITILLLAWRWVFVVLSTIL